MVTSRACGVIHANPHLTIVERAIQPETSIPTSSSDRQLKTRFHLKNLNENSSKMFRESYKQE
jgi:hypothetical protein